MKNLLNIFETINHIKEEGHIVLIKFDGEREKDQITVVLSFMKPDNRQVFQRHGEDLIVLLNKLIEDYLRLTSPRE